MASRLIETGSIDIEAIKDQHPLAEIVSKFVPLKRRSGLLEGLCPFHEERSPSFKIYERDDRYHCFGCGAHGDVFDFLEAQESMDLRAAAEYITGGHYPTYTADRIEELRAKRAAFEAQEIAERAKIIVASQARWDAAVPAHIHPYLLKKGIQPHGARIESDGCLLTPLIGQNGKVQCVQSISSDGQKLFPYKGTVTGGFYVLGGRVVEADQPVIICEGFATAATIQEATGRVVICTYSGPNMVAVANFFAKKYPDKRFFVAGDNDRGKKENAGLKHATRASEALSCDMVMPVFPEGDEGTDFNDMAKAYSLNAVRDLIVDGVLPSGEKVERDVFGLLDLDELEALPPPEFIVDGVLTETGFAILYGPPGSGKSFVALDMALRLAYGMDWHGRATKQTGVVYIAGEGSAGLGKRVKGWRREHALEGVEAPFLLLPQAVQFLDGGDLAKLLRTIDAAIDRCGFKIGLTVIDTVSRAITGADENTQETMSQFVHAGGIVQKHMAGAVLGIHHTGKDESRGMRGSTVLIGACDTSMRCAGDVKEDGFVTLTMEKQKDSEQIDPVVLEMVTVEWVQGLGTPISTKVPRLMNAQEIATATPLMTREKMLRVFKLVEDGWNEKAPWGVIPQAKRRGRYLPDWMVETFGMNGPDALGYVIDWQKNNLLRIETVSGANRGSGLKVISWPL